MTPPPTWVRGADPATAEMAGDNLRLRKDVARDRLRLRGVGHLATDQDSARRELTEEQRALRDSRPKTRRWKALSKLDLEVDRMKQRQDAASTRLQEAEAALALAPEDDARALADWLADGEKGGSPTRIVVRARTGQGRGEVARRGCHRRGRQGARAAPTTH